MNVSLRKWLQVSVFNLMLVACAGVVLRYKIAFSLPWVDQKFLLHGHSHFAFAGWVTQALMSLLVQYLSENGFANAFKKYRWLLYANLITAYGMLISFPLEGYALFSIIFSTLSIFVSYFFAVIYIKDLKRLSFSNSTHAWFKSALIFNALSSLGAFTLAFMLATKQSSEQIYLASIYFFLHFQYNGWFFFACMGFLNYQLIKIGMPDKNLLQVFKLFFFACIPAYLLSTLWLPLPVWVYCIIVVAALTQVFSWIKLILVARPYIHQFRESIPKYSRLIFILVAFALTIKLVLQALSVIPSLSNLAFGFRPIVIGYLHLVLLGIITLFILGYIFSQDYLPVNKTIYSGLFVFISGILLNEIVLMLQGTGDIWYIAIPHADLYLLAAALLLFGGLFFLNYGLLKTRYAQTHKLKQHTD
ncbi:MAG: hypothetical protein JSU05_06295 [Bacteroidetes bacterium]|nr:hypothetical protein [Bacteroidota bacterium]